MGNGKVSGTMGYFKETVGKIINTRERVKKELAGLGFTFPDSMSNFIFASHETIPAAELFQALKQEGIYVAISTSRGLIITCASPWERTRRWTGF